MSKIIVTIQIDTPIDMSEWEGLSIREHIIDNIIEPAIDWHKRAGFELMMNETKGLKRLKDYYFGWADAIKEAQVDWEWESDIWGESNAKMDSKT